MNLKEAVDRYKEERNLHQSSRFIGHNGPFLYTKLITDAYDEMISTIWQKEVLGEDKEITSLETFAIKILVIHLEEYFNKKYNPKTGQFE